MSGQLNIRDIQNNLVYFPETGEIFWKMKGPNRKKGPVGTLTSRGYLRVAINKKAIFLHRAAWVLMTGNYPPEFIDHINRDKTDNRWSNLRSASRSENAWNAKLSSRNTSGVKGLSYNKKTGLWRAQICRVSKHFKSKESAVNHINQERRSIHGDFSNFG